MATVLTDVPISPIHSDEWTVADLLERLGDIPPQRVRMVPWPGTATEEDVLAVEARSNRLCELIDGTLVEKTMGFLESRLAVRIIYHIESFLDKQKLGIVTGEGGFIRLLPHQVRIPDVAFFSWERLPGRRVPKAPIPPLAPDLAIEVLSPGNTRREMERKLAEYFAAGARLVWYIDPKTRTARAYTSVEQSTEIDQQGSLSGGEVLPGFELALGPLLAEAEGEVAQ